MQVKVAILILLSVLLINQTWAGNDGKKYAQLQPDLELDDIDFGFSAEASLDKVISKESSSKENLDPSVIKTSVRREGQNIILERDGKILMVAKRTLTWGASVTRTGESKPFAHVQRLGAIWAGGVHVTATQSLQSGQKGEVFLDVNIKEGSDGPYEFKAGFFHSPLLAEEVALRLQNQTPWHHPQVGGHVIRFFENRVKLPSIRNVKLVSESDPNEWYLQFGKVSANSYVLDFKAPLNLRQAFSFAVSVLLL